MNHAKDICRRPDAHDEDESGQPIHRYCSQVECSRPPQAAVDGVLEACAVALKRQVPTPQNKVRFECLDNTF